MNSGISNALRSEPAKPGSQQRRVGRIRDAFFIVTLTGLGALIPTAVWTVGTPHEWIYWLIGTITVGGRIGTLWYPPNGTAMRHHEGGKQ